MESTDPQAQEGPRLNDRYFVQARIGEGGMAGVYRVYDERLRVWRAAKVLFPEFARKRKVRRRFEAEAHTMARLEHPNLVRVVDVGHSGRLPFIVMELVPCGTLMQWIERHGPMPERMAIDAMLQVCDAVREVHANGVVHRDIKPHNVLVTEHGVCKLTDFGIAHEDGEEKTKAGSVMGTMGYMAPEQRNDASTVDARADIYGVAATLWKLVTNGPVRDLFMYEEDPRILEGISPGLGEVLMACFAYNRDHRPETIDDVIEALHYLRDAMPEPPADTPLLPLEGAMDAAAVEAHTFDEIAQAFTESRSSLSESSIDEEQHGGILSSGGLEAPVYTPPRPTPPPSSRRSDLEWADGAVSHAPVEEVSIGVDPAFVASTTPAPPPPREPTPAPPPPRDPTPPPAPQAAVATPPPPEARAGQTIGIDGTTTDAPEAPPPPPPEPEGFDPVRIGVMLFAVLLFVGVVSVGGLLGWSVTTVASAQGAALQARQAYYQVLEEERGVVAEAKQFDRSAQSLEELYLQYLDEADEPGRKRAADRFSQGLSEVYRELSGKPGASERLGRSVHRIQTARDVDASRYQAWGEAAESFPGVLASGLGLAASP